ncbi:MAG: rod shape-determining protein [Eubacterium sp.]|jgi:Actin-like ATPase involved in cell morphogenesis|nr:rod shape-determining protein [Eubacterium sp.]
MLGKAIGIDFGTSSIKFYKNGEGVILHEKSVIAVYNKNHTFAVGNEAFEMYEKAPVNIEVSYPVKNGVIADIGNMQSMIDYFFQQLDGKRKLKGADYYIAVPTDITEVEKRAYFELISNTNLKPKKIYVVEKPIADALGMSLDITKSTGTLVVDIGANTTEISVLSLGGIVLSRLIPVGGNKFDEVIISKIKKDKNFVIGEKTAELIKKTIGSAYVTEETIDICGRNLVTGLPSEITITGKDVYDALIELFQTIVDSVKIILERTPPEISSDIYKSGVYITGGSSRIKDLGRFVYDQLGLKVNLCEEPESTVIMGLGAIIEDPSLAKLTL